jgi:F-type H+-transporting ATPase subunit delta
MQSPAVFNFSQALVELAKEKGLVTKVRASAEQVAVSLKVPELIGFLNHPKVPVSAKKEIIMRLIPEDAPQEMINFLNLLFDRHRESLLSDIMEETVNLAIKAEGYEIVELISAKALSEEERITITRDLEKSWSARIFLKYRENPGLIGGIIVRRADQLYDGSLAGQLKALKHLLLEKTELPI